jgi:hypothetical protein
MEYSAVAMAVRRMRARIGKDKSLRRHMTVIASIVILHFKITHPWACGFS